MTLLLLTAAVDLAALLGLAILVLDRRHRPGPPTPARPTPDLEHRERGAA